MIFTQGEIDMKVEIVRLANRLCELLDLCNDADFVDMVCSAVACNDPIDIDEIKEDEEAQP
nr:MAG TPA: hypothetical protein [Caudoviricetes sp.]